MIVLVSIFRASHYEGEREVTQLGVFKVKLLPNYAARRGVDDLRSLRWHHEMVPVLHLQLRLAYTSCR
jgi:hypothetical protein